jgi:AcrR family transcriptional regulator
MPKENKNDLRVIRTKSGIKSAVKELIMELDASKITVQRITQKAMINRKTFYLHFSCIEALFDDLFQELVSDYASFMDQYPLIHSFKGHE